MCFQGTENGSCWGLGLGAMIVATPYFLDLPDVSSFRPQSWCCGHLGEENSRLPLPGLIPQFPRCPPHGLFTYW